MITIIELVLKIGATLIDIFWKRSQKNAEMKEKMFEFARISDAEAIKNANLSKDYKAMKEELQKKEEPKK